MRVLVICLLLTGLVSEVLAETAEPIRNPSKNFICSDRHGKPAVVSEQKYRSLVESGLLRESNCREELTWESGAHWLCRLNDHVLLADYPVDRVGILLSPEQGIDLLSAKTFECRKVEAKCKDHLFLIKEKRCYQEITTNSKDYWLKFAKQANQASVQFASLCEGKKPTASFSGQGIHTSCLSESCVLQHPSRIWSAVLELFDPSEDAEIDLSYFPPQRFVLRQQHLEQQIETPGLYCLDYWQKELLHDPVPVYEYVLRYARFLNELPLGWSAVRSAAPEGGSEKSAADMFTCNSDADCVQGVGRGVCKIKALAGEEQFAPKPDYRCVCVKGPTVFGCVSKTVVQ